MSNLPACLRPALFERVAEGWTADGVAAWLGEKYGVRATGSDVLSTLKQANAEHREAKTIVREHMRAELPAILDELACPLPRLPPTLENLALRQQLALLRRRSKRPQFGLDLLWVWLSNKWAGWRGALHLVRPETVIRWHWQGLRAFWIWKSRGRMGRPRVGSKLADLVRKGRRTPPPLRLPRSVTAADDSPASSKGSKRNRRSGPRSCRQPRSGRALMLNSMAPAT